MRIKLYLAALLLALLVVACGQPALPRATEPGSPLGFQFSTLHDADVGNEYTSPVYRVAGLNNAAQVSTSTGTLIINGTPIGQVGSVQNDDTLAVRIRSSEEFLTSSSAIVQIAEASARFIVVTKPSEGQVNTRKLGSAGGIVSSSDGLAYVDIPEGAIPEGMEITVSVVRSDELPPSEFGHATHVNYKFEPSGFEFMKPVRIYLNLTDDDWDTETEPTIILQSGRTGEWAELQNIEFHDSGHVSGETSHFSIAAQTLATRSRVYHWPLRYQDGGNVYRITQPYASFNGAYNPKDPKNPEAGKDKYHAGIDIATGSAFPNGIVTAFHDGYLVCVNDRQPNNGFGYTVVLRHSLPELGTVYSLYGHLDSFSAQVNMIANLPLKEAPGGRLWCVDDPVNNKSLPIRGGSDLGVEGSTNAAGQVHLHFELRDFYQAPQAEGAGSDLRFGYIRGNHPSELFKGKRYFDPLPLLLPGYEELRPSEQWVGSPQGSPNYRPGPGANEPIGTFRSSSLQLLVVAKADQLDAATGRIGATCGAEWLQVKPYSLHAPYVEKVKELEDEPLHFRQEYDRNNGYPQSSVPQVWVCSTLVERSSGPNPAPGPTPDPAISAPDRIDINESGGMRQMRLHNQVNYELQVNVTSTSSWLTLDQTSVRLSANGSSNLSVSIAECTTSSLRTARIQYSTGSPSTSLGATLVLQDCETNSIRGQLSVSPTTRVTVSGSQGGFSDVSVQYVLENTGNAALDWVLWGQAGTGTYADIPWGTLQAGQRDTITITFRAAYLNSLNQGNADQEFTFKDDTNSEDIFRTVRISVSQPTQLPPQDLIRNGSFSQGRTSDWTMTGDAWIQPSGGTDSLYRTPIGYAAIGVASSDGRHRTNADGSLTQTVTIPKTANQARLRLYHYMTRSNSPGTGEFRIQVLDDACPRAESAAILWERRLTEAAISQWYRELNSGWFDLDGHYGATCLRITGSTSGSYPVVFRLDDVSLEVRSP